MRRAKALDHVPDTGNEAEMDFEDVRLDSCKFIKSRSKRMQYIHIM